MQLSCIMEQGVRWSVWCSWNIFTVGLAYFHDWMVNTWQ